jgi:hypothetical protein
MASDRTTSLLRLTGQGGDRDFGFDLLLTGQGIEQAPFRDSPGEGWRG